MDVAHFGPGRFLSDIAREDTQDRLGTKWEGQHRTDRCHLMHCGLTASE